MIEPDLRPTLLPLGDSALLVRFSEALSAPANAAAIAFARGLGVAPIGGVAEVAPGLVSVLLRLAPDAEFGRVRGEIALRLGHFSVPPEPALHEVAVVFDGPDLAEVAGLCDLRVDDFIARHDASTLTVLATGFAPGFVYYGFHGDDLVVPRREALRPMVPAGTVLFAAGQTAIAATPIRTGWHVIGRTGFQNFDPASDPPTRLAAGDAVRFTSTA